MFGQVKFHCIERLLAKQADCKVSHQHTSPNMATQKLAVQCVHISTAQCCQMSPFALSFPALLAQQVNCFINANVASQSESSSNYVQNNAAHILNYFLIAFYQTLDKASSAIKKLSYEKMLPSRTQEAYFNSQFNSA